MKKAAKKIKRAIKRLRSAGAQRFFVVNAPDIGDLPATQRLDQENNGINQQLPYGFSWEIIARYGSITFNYYLQKMVNRLNNKENNQIVVFDLFQYSKHFKRYASSYQIDNIKDACLLAQEQRFSDGCEMGKKLDNYFYFDEIHPSAKVHERLGFGLFSTFRNKEQKNSEGLLKPLFLSFKR